MNFDSLVKGEEKCRKIKASAFDSQSIRVCSTEGNERKAVDGCTVSANASAQATQAEQMRRW